MVAAAIKLRIENSCDGEPRAVEVSASAFGASSRWVEGLARELEAAVGADGGAHSEAFAIGFGASLDVTEIVLEGTDLDGQFVAKFIEDPFLLTQAPNDLLATGECRAHGSAVGGRSGPPVANHSRTGSPST